MEHRHGTGTGRRDRAELSLALLIAAVVAVLLGSPAGAGAEVREIRITKQYGIGYLPLVIMEEEKLIEKHARAAGLGDVKATWATLGSGATANEALLSGGVDFVSGGVAPMITAWAKTKGDIKGVAAIDTQPLYLNTTNPAVKSIRDLTEKDRIALPAVKVSIQAVVLQKAAAAAFGDARYDSLDRFTVSMKHPDAAAALLSGKSEITGHLTSAPYIQQELKNPNVRAILNSYDVFGGPHTFNVVWTTRKFREDNPKAYAAFLAALEEAVTLANKDKRAAAAIYARATKPSPPVEEIEGLIGKNAVSFSTTPLRTLDFAVFMHRIGSIKVRPNEWRDFFFPNIHDRKGS